MQNDNNKYESVIPYKIMSIVSLTIETKQFDFSDALKYVYTTRLYELLANEETKLWHLSPKKLFEILENEKKNNTLELPDFV